MTCMYMYIMPCSLSHITGSLGGVVGLNCINQPSFNIIQCNWTVPYTLPGVDITGYNINITSNDTLLIMTTVDVTQYTYNVNEFGVYTVSVMANASGGLEGVIDKNATNVPEGIGKNNVT